MDKSLTFRLPGFEPLNSPLKVAKLLSCITYQLYTKFMSEVEPIYEAFHVSSPGAAREREIMLFSACV